MALFPVPNSGWKISCAILLLGILAAPNALAKDAAQPKQGPMPIHGQNWAFGHSVDRNSPLWIKGIAAEEISSKAKPKIKNKQQGADTSNGIDAALTRAEKKSGVGLKMKNETSVWKVAPGQEHQPDETIAREGKHVLGAYAGVKATDNLNISVGPELIIKDEQNVQENANANQPDAALGLGMNFTLDF